MTIKIEPHKSSLGMDANMMVLVMFVGMAILSWIPYIGYIAWAVPLVIFFMEKNSKFVKFQAVQALIIGVVRFAFMILFSILAWAFTPRYNSVEDVLNWDMNLGALAVLGVIGVIVGLAIMAVIIYVVISAWNYKQVELPFIAEIAKKAAGKLETVQFNNPQPNTQQNPAQEEQNTPDNKL